MARRLGDSARRLVAAHALLSAKGQREREHFLFEGASLLAEARASGVAIEEIFATQTAYDETPALQALDREGVAVWLVSSKAARRLSDVETPTGIAGVAQARFTPLGGLVASGRTVLVLAGISDPGNAGTLLRAAEAFGAGGVVFGRGGVHPFHPKVVRAAMGAIFRLPLALATPQSLSTAAREAGRSVEGLAAGGALEVADLPAEPVIVVGQERRGLGAWEEACSRCFRIPMAGRAESLNAAVAGSIALYEASRKTAE